MNRTRIDAVAFAQLASGSLQALLDARLVEAALARPGSSSRDRRGPTGGVLVPPRRCSNAPPRTRVLEELTDGVLLPLPDRRAEDRAGVVIQGLEGAVDVAAQLHVVKSQFLLRG